VAGVVETAGEVEPGVVFGGQGLVPWTLALGTQSTAYRMQSGHFADDVEAGAGRVFQRACPGH
jgi:hypothetical protein